MGAQTFWPIVIVGPGAIGLHLAFSLTPHHPVELRHPTVEGPVDCRSAQRGSMTITCRRVADPAPIQAVIIATKAHQAASAFELIEPALTENAEILLMHNGLGPQQAISDRLLPHQSLGVAITTEAVLRTGPNAIEETGQGVTWLGPWSGHRRPGFLEQAILDSPLASHWEPDAEALQARVWQKLLINAAINPLTALADVPNGALARADLQQQWRALLPELVTIAGAAGHSVTESGLAEQVLSVIGATAGNRSSMHQDLANGRTPELQSITGSLLQYARDHSIETPVLTGLHNAVCRRFEERGVAI